MPTLSWKIVQTTTELTELSKKKAESILIKKGSYAHAIVLFYESNVDGSDGKYLFYTDYSPAKGVEDVDENAELKRVDYAPDFFDCGGGASASFGLITHFGTVATSLNNATFKRKIAEYYKEFVASVSKKMSTTLHRGYPYDCKGYCGFIVEKLTGVSPFDGSASSAAASSSA